MSVNAAHPPTAASIQQTMAKDLRNVYLTTYNTGTVDVGDIVDKCHVNSRYARELLGVLEHADLLVKPDEGGSEWTYNVDFFQDKADNEDSAQEVVDGWLKEHGLAPQTPSTATSPAKDKPATPRTPKSKSPTGTCLCGCGSPTRSNFAPGHDARMAGQVAREIAERAIRDDMDPRDVNDYFTDLLSKLPSGDLRVKALNHADRLVAKASTRPRQAHASEAQIEAAIEAGEKAAETDMERALRTGTIEPTYTYGTVKIGKNRFAARRDNDGVIMRTRTAAKERITDYLGQEYTGTVEGNAAKTFTADDVQP
jgi:hypothetical protein